MIDFHFGHEFVITDHAQIYMLAIESNVQDIDRIYELVDCIVVMLRSLDIRPLSTGKKKPDEINRRQSQCCFYHKIYDCGMRKSRIAILKSAFTYRQSDCYSIVT